jgi:hypothetical protein
LTGSPEARAVAGHQDQRLRNGFHDEAPQL